MTRRLDHPHYTPSDSSAQMLQPSTISTLQPSVSTGQSNPEKALYEKSCINSPDQPGPRTGSQRGPDSAGNVTGRNVRGQSVTRCQRFGFDCR
jgi:hypothetical protein